MQHHTETAPPDHFPTETTGLPASRRSEIVELADGATLHPEIAPVAKQLGDATVRMLSAAGVSGGAVFALAAPYERAFSAEGRRLRLGRPAGVAARCSSSSAGTLSRGSRQGAPGCSCRSRSSRRLAMRQAPWRSAPCADPRHLPRRLRRVLGIRAAGGVEARRRASWAAWPGATPTFGLRLARRRGTRPPGAISSSRWWGRGPPGPPRGSRRPRVRAAGAGCRGRSALR